MAATDTDTGAPPGSDDERVAPVRRRRRPVASLLALAFFFAPLVAFAAGERPAAFENRALAEFPSLSDGWEFFPDFTTWAVDHLPLREEAVEVNAELAERIFDEAPSFGAGSGGGSPAGVPSGQGESDASLYARVIEGEDGWLYFGSDVSELCEPTRTVEDVMDRLDRLAAAVESSGRRFVVTVAPDKSTIVPDYLPATYYGQDCATERRTAFWAALRTAPPSGYVDLRADLEAEQERSGEYLYRRTDTHWTSGGSAIYAQNLAEALDPELWADTDVVDAGTTSRTGDLGRLIGRPREDEYAAVEVRRRGVTPVGRDGLDLPEMPYTPITVTNRTTGAALFEAPTLLIGDSFTSASRQALGSLFADLTLLHGDVAEPFPEAVAAEMAAADVVVFEVVERTLASGEASLLNDEVLAAVEAELARRPR